MSSVITSPGSTPDWAVPRPGDTSKWLPATGLIDALRRQFSHNIHAPCGGNWVVVGTSGVLTHREYYRCDRCGAQTNSRIEY